MCTQRTSKHENEHKVKEGPKEALKQAAVAVHSVTQGSMIIISPQEEEHFCAIPFLVGGTNDMAENRVAWQSVRPVERPAHFTNATNVCYCWGMAPAVASRRACLPSLGQPRRHEPVSLTRQP